MHTPSQILASKILEQLLKEKLLTEQDAKKLLPKFSEGKLRPEDWRLPLELVNKKGPAL